MSLQMMQKPDNLRSRERVLVALQEELSLRRHPADHRQMVPSERFLQHGGPSPRRVGEHHEGQQVEPCLIDKDERGAYAGPFFTSAGYCSSRHARIAASSRWRARRTGFWRVQPQRPSSRPTWVGW